MRTVEPWLRDILRCPSCSGVLRDGVDHRETADGVISAGRRPELHCTVCRLAYRIDDGIPVLLVGEARPIADEE